MSWWMQLIACFLATFAYAALVRQPKSSVLISALVGTLGYGVYLLLNQSTAGYFCAALLIAVSCEICARIMKRVATAFVTGAIIPLVPGVGLYRTMRCVVDGDYQLAITLGTETLLGLCGIALAITITAFLFSNFRLRGKKKGSPC